MTAFQNFLAFIGLICFVIGFVALIGCIVPQPRLGFRTRKRSALVLFGCFVGLLIVGSGLPQTPPPAETTGATSSAAPAIATAAPPTLAIRELDRSIEEAQDNGRVIYVRLGLKAWNPTDVITQAGMVAEKIGRTIKAGDAGIGPQAAELNIQVRVTTMDNLGNDRQGNLMWLTLPIADLKRANYDNLGAPGTLNLATTVEPSAILGRDLVARWCDNAAHSEQVAASFCGLALRPN
jgi:hypothetical protein